MCSSLFLDEFLFEPCFQPSLLILMDVNVMCGMLYLLSFSLSSPFGKYKVIIIRPQRKKQTKRNATAATRLKAINSLCYVIFFTPSHAHHSNSLRFGLFAMIFSTYLRDGSHFRCYSVRPKIQTYAFFACFWHVKNIVRLWMPFVRSFIRVYSKILTHPFFISATKQDNELHL